jgi:hypothetical protein
MVQVVRYEHPEIFVTSQRTGETYKFRVRDDGTLAHAETSFEQGEARRAEISYLVQKGCMSGDQGLH